VDVAGVPLRRASPPLLPGQREMEEASVIKSDSIVATAAEAAQADTQMVLLLMYYAFPLGAVICGAVLEEPLRPEELPPLLPMLSEELRAGSSH
jgi:hypothetical protein